MGLEGVLGHLDLEGGRVHQVGHRVLGGVQVRRDRKVALGLKAVQDRKVVQVQKVALARKDALVQEEGLGLGGVLGLVEGRVRLGLQDLLARLDP